MFDSTKEDLKDILRDAHEGRLQLPDFQRDYVWTDEDVRSLLASIGKGYPVGALLTLETGSEVSFKPRLIVGVPSKDVEPSELLLDGQQRITSLYQSTFSTEPVKTRLENKKRVQVDRHYYLDIKKAVDTEADLYEAIIGVPADRIIRKNFGRDIELDLSSNENEFENNMFPMEKAFDSRDWFYKWRDYWKERNQDVVDLEKEFFRNVLERIERYKMPIIRLDRKNSREAICLVFEKVNVGGQKLDAFELLTAVYASENYDLRIAWSGNASSNLGIKKRLFGSEFPRGVLKELESIDFIQACTLLHTRDQRLSKEAEGKKGKELPQISCRRDALLGLPLHRFKEFKDAVEQGFLDAAVFLNDQKFIAHNDLPYKTQMVALASIFATLGSEAQSIPAKQKITQWFWSGCLGELYGGGGSETRMAIDLNEVVTWIQKGESVPRTLGDAIFQQDRFRSLRARLSAGYKAIHALLMKHGCRDFIHGDSTELMTFFQRKIDIHHIFPRAWCTKQGIDKKVFDSIVNKTPLSKKSNIAVGGDAPSKYLAKIEKKTGITSDKLDEILRTHLIEPSYLRSDDFEGFFNARIQALSELVGSAMGKPVVMEHGSDEPETELNDESDIETEFDEVESI